MREKLLFFIIRYKEENNGNSPSYREMCVGIDAGSTAVIQYHITKLEADGHIIVNRNKARSITIPNSQWTLC